MLLLLGQGEVADIMEEQFTYLMDHRGSVHKDRNFQCSDCERFERLQGLLLEPFRRKQTPWKESWHLSINQKVTATA